MPVQRYNWKQGDDTREGQHARYGELLQGVKKPHYSSGNRVQMEQKELL